jgi:hypothetical protein
MPLAIIPRCVLLSLLVTYGSATSIVVKLDKQRIILAADTRQDRLDAPSGISHHSFHDDGCKILPLGKAAMGASGNMDYKRNDPSDSIPDWDTLSDAKEAYKLHGEDLRKVADEWAQRGASHYNIFYKVASLRVRELASTNSDHVLVDAFFVEWDTSREPLLIWEKVYLDENPPMLVRTSSQMLPYRELPYTTNFTTQQLVEGDPARVKTTAARWKSESLEMTEAERDWRSLEFLIKVTSEYEESVGSRVNVLEIPLGGQAQWLQNLTCPK